MVITVGLSQNKAYVYYSNGKMEYYRDVRNSTVERFYSRIMKPTSVMNLTATINYQFQQLAVVKVSIKWVAFRSQFVLDFLENKPIFWLL